MAPHTSFPFHPLVHAVQHPLVQITYNIALHQNSATLLCSNYFQKSIYLPDVAVSLDLSQQSSKGKEGTQS